MLCIFQAKGSYRSIINFVSCSLETLSLGSWVLSHLLFSHLRFSVGPGGCAYFHDHISQSVPPAQGMQDHLPSPVRGSMGCSRRATICEAAPVLTQRRTWGTIEYESMYTYDYPYPWSSVNNFALWSSTVNSAKFLIQQNWTGNDATRTWCDCEYRIIVRRWSGRE